MKRRFLSLMLSLIVCLTSVMAVSSTVVNAATEVVLVYLNGTPITFPANDAQPQIISNRTYVPIRATCDALGLSIEWNSKTETLTFTRENTVISHTMRSSTVYVNGEAKSYDTKSVNKNNRTLMPIRMLADAIGANVEWDNETRSVLITTTPSTVSSGVEINSVNSSASSAASGKSVTISVVANSATEKVKLINNSNGKDITEINEYLSNDDGTRSFEAKVTCEGDDVFTVNAVAGTSAGGYDSNSTKSIDIKISSSDNDKDDEKDDDEDEDEDDSETTVKSFDSDHFIKLVYTNSVKKNGYVKLVVTTDDEVKKVKIESSAADEEVVLKEYDEDDDERVFEGRIKLTSTGSQKIKIDLYTSEGYEDINESFKVTVGNSSSSSKDDDDDDGDGKIYDVEIVNDAFYVSQGSPIYVTTSTDIDYVEILADDDRVCGKTSFTTSKTSSEKLWTLSVTVSETGRNKYTVNAYRDDEVVDDYNVTLNGRKFSRTEPAVLSMDQKTTSIKAGDEVRFTAKVTGCVTRIDVRKETGGSILGTGDSSASSSSTKSMTVSFEVNDFDAYYIAYAYDSSGGNTTYTFRITGDTYQEIEITDIEIDDEVYYFGDPVTATVYTTNSCEKLWVEDSRGDRVSRTYTSPNDEEGDEYVWEVVFSSIEDTFKSSRSFTIIAEDEDKETDEKSITVKFKNTSK